MELNRLRVTSNGYRTMAVAALPATPGASLTTFLTLERRAGPVMAYNHRITSRRLACAAIEHRFGISPQRIAFD
jgi:hypothetical protein